MADEKVFEKLRAEIASLKAAHQTFKDRVYELFDLEQEDDPYSLINLVECKRKMWAIWQGYKPDVAKPATKSTRRFNPQPKPMKRK